MSILSGAISFQADVRASVEQEDKRPNDFECLRNKLSQFKIITQQLEIVRNELHLIIKTLEELVRREFPDV